MHACGSHNIATVDLLLEETWLACLGLLVRVSGFRAAGLLGITAFRA